MSEKEEMTLTSFMKTVCRDCMKNGGEKAYRLASLSIEALSYGETYDDSYVFQEGFVMFLKLMQSQSKNLLEV